MRGSNVPTPPSGAAETTAPMARLTVEYWTVAMGEQESCGSCDATLSLIEDALEEVRPMADRLGIAVGLVSRKVGSWPEAVEHAIVASPTVRSAGIELSPSHPDESETRVWTWRGTAAASPSEQAILDFLVQAVAAHSRRLGEYLSRGGPAPYVRRFLYATSSPEESGSRSC